MSNLTAAGLSTFAVGLPKTFSVADFGDVVGVVTTRLPKDTLNSIVAVRVASASNPAGASLSAILDDLPAVITAYHD